MMRSKPLLRRAAIPTLAMAIAIWSAAPTALAQSQDVMLNGGGGRNAVVVVNRADKQFALRGSIQLNGTPAPAVAAVNLADASASCIDCQTLAVALQINLIGTGATVIAPQNVARAVNVGCLRCNTVAIAIQYTLQVPDPAKAPQDVRLLLQAMDGELTRLGAEARTGTVTVADAEARINAVIGQFSSLAAGLSVQRMVAGSQ